jgi:phosphatidylinositol 4-kinase
MTLHSYVAEFVQVMGPKIERFRYLCKKAYMAARRQRNKIILLVEIALASGVQMPCFDGGREEIMSNLKSRFNPDLKQRACLEHVDSLIDDSLHSWRTRCYDRFQRCCVGIY